MMSQTSTSSLTFCPADPRFLYSTLSSVNLLEFQGRTSSDTELFAAGDGILSFDLDWDRDWLYWANHTGHIQRTSLTQINTEVIPTPVPGDCLEFINNLM